MSQAVAVLDVGKTNVKLAPIGLPLTKILGTREWRGSKKSYHSPFALRKRMRRSRSHTMPPSYSTSLASSTRIRATSSL